MSSITSSIPSSRSVIGRDLEEIKQQFGLTTGDACFLFGVSITKWTQLVRSSPDVQIKDPTLALLVRFLSQHPELSVIPKMPTTSEMFNTINSVVETDQKRFSLLLGAEASAGNRWKRSGSRPGQSLERLMYYLRLAILSRSHGERVELLDSWRQTVAAEGRARNVDDIFRAGQWAPRSVIELSKQSIGAKASKSKAKSIKKTSLRNKSSKA